MAVATPALRISAVALFAAWPPTPISECDRSVCRTIVDIERLSEECYLRGSLRDLAVLLIIVTALQAVVAQTASRLRAYTNTIANLYLAGVVLADLGSLTNDLVANLTSVSGLLGDVSKRENMR